MASRATRVRCGDVELKLTLTAKQLDRPFDTAVIAPFLKAYSKKVGALEPVSLAQVSVVRVDDEQIGDLSLASSVVLLVSEVVETEIFLKTPAVTQESLAANPFGAVGGGVSGAQAAAGTVDFDGDERSAIEKLKDERRARRKAEGESDSGLAVGDRVTVDGLTSETGRAINGEAGTLVRFVAESGRWEVRLDSQSERTFNLKSENLSQIVRFKESFNMKADAATPAPPAPAAPPAAAEGPSSAERGTTPQTAEERCLPRRRRRLPSAKSRSSGFAANSETVRQRRSDSQRSPRRHSLSASIRHSWSGNFCRRRS